MTGIHKIKPNTILFKAWILLFLVQCGIEVGNPHSDEDDIEESRITIEITDAPVDDVSHVYLNIEKLYLVNNDGDLVELALDISGPIDILSLQDGTTSVLVQNQSVTLEAIKGYFIALNEDEPGYVITGSDETKSLYLPEQRNHIFIEESSALTDLKSVVLHFDLRHSLNLDESGNYYIDPVIYSVKRSESALITGRFLDLNRGFVCLYKESELGLAEMAKEPLALERPGPLSRNESVAMTDDPKRMLSGNEDAGALPPPPRIPPDGRLPPPPSIGDDRFVPKGDRPPHHASIAPPDGGRPPKPEDSNRICGDAYVGVPLKLDGSFAFHFLKSGRYSIRVFEGPLTYHDMDGTISLEPGSSKELGELLIKN